MNQVHVPGVAREGEVVAVRKEWIERAERVVSGLVITRRCVDLEAQTRHPGEVGDGVPTTAADRPGADAFAGDVTSLAHRFEVPVEPAARAGVSDVEVVAALVAARVEKAGLVEDEARLALLPVQPRGVVGLPDVRTVAHRDEPLQIERHLLPPHAGLQRAAPERIDVGDEGQTEIQRVLVDWRDDVFRRRADVLELDEDLPVLIWANVDVPLETVQQVTVALVASNPEQRRVVHLEALAHGETEGYVTLWVVEQERDVLQAVERLGSKARVGQRRPVFQPAVEQIYPGANCLVVLSRRRRHARS